MKTEPPASLDPDGLLELGDLIGRMEQHQGPWATAGGGEQIGERMFTMPYVVPSPIVEDALRFLYDQGLIIVFDWPSWDEGRAILQDESDDRFAKLDRITILKLLTAVARNDRFYDGAWAALFEDGDAQKLFKRLLETETGNA